MLTGSKYYFENFVILQNNNKSNLTALSNNNINLEKDKTMNEVSLKTKENSFEKQLQIKGNQQQIQNQTTKFETSKKLERQDKSKAKGNKSNNNLMNLNKDIKIVNKYEMTLYINKIYNILERIFITYQIIKNEKSYKIIFGEKNEFIEYDILIKKKDNVNFFDLDNEQFIKYASFVKLVNYIQKIDKIISNEYQDKDFIGIKLLFVHEKLNEKQNKNGIYNLTCQYGAFSFENMNADLKYKDENILINGFNQGFLSLLCEINEFLIKFGNII
jgi:hypothetical protein